MLRKPQAYKDDNIRDGPKHEGLSALANRNKSLVLHKKLEIVLTSLVTISFSIKTRLHGFSSGYIMFLELKKEAESRRSCELQKWWKILRSCDRAS